jgi:hypothetical protein
MTQPTLPNISLDNMFDDISSPSTGRVVENLQSPVGNILKIFCFVFLIFKT